MYNHLKQIVDAFEITLGINKGYGHNNECVTNFEADYQAIATDIYKRTGVYVSAVITPAKVVYNVDWGCPDDGEDVYIIKGVNNTQFVKPADYKGSIAQKQPLFISLPKTRASLSKTLLVNFFTFVHLPTWLKKTNCFVRFGNARQQTLLKSFITIVTKNLVALWLFLKVNNILFHTMTQTHVS